MKDKIVIKQGDRFITYVYPFYTDAEPVGSVLVLHGMAEHHERYIPFAEFLNANGYDVFLYDHRGHGADKKFEDLGHFADHGGDELVINDALAVLKFVKKVNRSSKTILFGHSMGSMIARNVISRFDDIDGCIICGTAYLPRIKCRFGLALSAVIRLIKGAHCYSPFLNELTVGYKDFSKISNRTSFDWLTRDNNIVGTYISDPLCGFICTTAFYHDLIRLTYTSELPKNIRKIRKDLPLLFISGSHDPVGGYGEGVSKLFAVYQRLGFEHSDCTIYENCRHELLNELNNGTIMEDILTWCKSL